MSSLPTSSSSTTEPSTSWAESLLARDLYKLSMGEREKVMEELHGVSDVVNETAESIAISLADLDGELSKIKGKAAYDAAKARDPEYVNSLELRLKFLRAARFDPVGAAERMVGFFEKKFELFGAGPLARELRLTDLDKGDRACLKGGIMTLLPLRDRAGRGVVTWIPMLRGESTTLSRLRCMMYVFSVAALEEETQRKGLIYVWLDAGPNRTLIESIPAAQLGPQITSVAPARISAIHVCVGDSKLTRFWNLIRASTEPSLLTRIRFHCGCAVEIHYKLMTFGIPTDSLPMAMSGEINVDYHRAWYVARETLEIATGKKQASIIACRDVTIPAPFGAQVSGKADASWSEKEGSASPSDGHKPGKASPHVVPDSDDSKAASSEQGLTILPANCNPHVYSVVCSRVSKTQLPIGNSRLNILARALLQEYADDTKAGKTIIVSRIMDMVRSNSPGGQGAFIRWHEERWWEVDEVGARYKVSAIMRDLLPSQYKSSTKAKVAKRRIQNRLKKNHA